LEELDRGRVEVDIILVDRDRAHRVRIEIIQADTANEDRRVRGRECRLDRQVGCVGREVCDIDDPLALNHRRVELHDRNRRSDRAFRALAGDGDLLDAFGRRGDRLLLILGLNDFFGVGRVQRRGFGGFFGLHRGRVRLCTGLLLCDCGGDTQGPSDARGYEQRWEVRRGEVSRHAVKQTRAHDAVQRNMRTAMPA